MLRLACQRLGTKQNNLEIDMGKRGFTLIELMLAIAIVGLVVAIVVGGLAQEDTCKEDVMISCEADGKAEYECLAYAKQICEPDVVYVY
jgi:prepilin-type N-terminal cleavage/methylation domain-containing protein